LNNTLNLNLHWQVYLKRFNKSIGNFVAKRKAECEVPMVLRDMSEALKELEGLAQDKNLSCISPEVKQSKFYKMLRQGVKTLDASNLNVSSDVMKLLACIIVDPSLELYKLSFSNNSLCKSGVNVSEILSKSTTLRNIDLSDNWLDEAISEVTKNLLKIPTLNILSMQDNNLACTEHELSYSEADISTLEPQCPVNIKCENEVRKIIDDHNQEVSLRAQLASTLESLKLPLDLIIIIGDYYYYGNLIELEL
jgi:hypothetical protein